MMTPSVSIAPVKQEAKPVEVVNEKEEEKLKGKNATFLNLRSKCNHQKLIIVTVQMS